MFPFCSLAVLTSLAVLAQREQPSVGSRMANVHILLIDGWGNEVPEALVRFKPIGSWGRVTWVQYPKERHITITPGRYVVWIDANGFRRFAEAFEFPAGSSFVPLNQVLADIEDVLPDAPPTLVGRVAKEFMKHPPCWIRIVGISSGAVKQIEVDGSGSFVLPDIMPGRYMLFLMNGGALKHSRIVEVRGPVTEVTLEGFQQKLPE